MIALYLCLVLSLLLLGFGTMRVSEWHQNESDYWRNVHYAVLAKPDLDALHRPVLMWARDHRPPPWRRALGWQSPPERMSAAGHA